MHNLSYYFAVCFLAATLAGCQTAPLPSDTALVPAPATAAPAPAGTQALSMPGLGSVKVVQNGHNPDYTITLNTPVMNGSIDPHVVAFNQAVSKLIQKQVDGFKKSLLELTPGAASSNGSTFTLDYELISENLHMISLRLKMDQYLAGAAHPLGTSLSLTYDLDRDQPISLDQLFVPGAAYLQRLSDYSKSTLAKTDVGSTLFEQGLTPTADNFRNWNISEQGLMITFDEYQVAPYAAGPQMVLVPYSLLKDIISPQGALAAYAH